MRISQVSREPYSSGRPLLPQYYVPLGSIPAITTCSHAHPIQPPYPRIRELLGIELPLLQAPMAGADAVALALAVCRAGGLGSLGCALRTPEEIRAAVHDLRAGTDRPFNLNFFCHTMAAPEPAAV